MTDRSKSTAVSASKSKAPKAIADAPMGKKAAASRDEARVGRRAELLDHERAIARPITYANDRHPMQSAPDHGPHK